MFEAIDRERNLLPVWMNDAVEYWVDAAQRMTLTWDVLRKRGNNYFDHITTAQPPVLTFDYDVVVDGKDLEKPVNYQLVRIMDPEGRTVAPDKRPIVIIDPRAGHGPGIGGSKRDSEIGEALANGHPVYFVLFYTQPMPGQTLSDVEKAEIQFLEKVRSLHEEADEPALIGNCQAGWASALIAADRPDVTGPVVLSGAPMSYWAGVEGVNPMRYRGGVMGGAWTASFLADLGNGTFDGANLVSNFEELNPANTIWSKQYNLYSKIDTEEKRFLNFEKWWGGFFLMTKEEIKFIVENLFVGNKLEEGELELEEGRKINLQNIEDPIVVFSSRGDNITPPQQALGWITKVYGSLEEIQRLGKVIVYTVHPTIGHLGIFVSGSVAQKEHHQIIGNIDSLEYFPPGLYEMVIINEGENMGVPQYRAQYEPRDMSDLMALDDGWEDEVDFRPAAEVSEWLSTIYETAVSPFIRSFTNEKTAETMRRLHPLRLQRALISDKNPLMSFIQPMAEMVRENRRPVDKSNPYWRTQENFSKTMIESLDFYRDMRDNQIEGMFHAMYGNPFMKALFPPTAKDLNARGQNQERLEQMLREEQADREKWLARIDQGGVAEGVVRVVMAMVEADHVLKPEEFSAAQMVFRGHKKLEETSNDDLKVLIKEQSRILQVDRQMALDALPSLLPDEQDRREAVEAATQIAFADKVLDTQEEELIIDLKRILGVANN